MWSTCISRTIRAAHLLGKAHNSLLIFLERESESNFLSLADVSRIISRVSYVGIFAHARLHHEQDGVGPGGTSREITKKL